MLTIIIFSYSQLSGTNINTRPISIIPEKKLGRTWVRKLKNQNLVCDYQLVYFHSLAMSEVPGFWSLSSGPWSDKYRKIFFLFPSETKL